MNLKDYEVNAHTHPFLIRLVHCYSEHQPMPSRQELLETQYELWNTEGHCTLRGLCEQVGVKYDPDDEEV